MCGIIGYVGHQQAAPILLDGLARMEYRGYDSAGVAVRSETKGLQVYKSKGRLQVLSDMIHGGADVEGTLGIGHTRWATHGEPNDINAHPHVSEDGRIAMVHNGIIENYMEIKQQLLRHGVTFKSETDTEVAAQLLEFHYNECHNMLEAVGRVLRRIEGSYAFGIICADYPNALIAARKDSPLIIGCGENENFIASDVTAVISHTRDVIYMEDGEIAVLTAEGVNLFNDEMDPIDKPHSHIDWDVSAAEKGGYPHFMLKEINEEPAAITATVSPRVENGLPELRIPELTDEKLRSIGTVHLVGCGTAMHAGMVGKTAIETLARVPAEVDIASEFRYRDPILKPEDLVIIISQSGETSDTLAALKLAKSRGVPVLAIVNVVGSSIARAADYVMYTYAGPEIAVASTKAYMVQLCVLYLFALYAAKSLGTVEGKEYKRLLTALRSLPKQMQTALDMNPAIPALAKKYHGSPSMFFIGRNTDYAVALEGALKMKEISYIHAESYAAGELKHGTIALIYEGQPVIALCCNDAVMEKTMSNIVEVKARGAEVLAVAFKGNGKIVSLADDMIFVPKIDPLLCAVAEIVPLQLLAYYVAKENGCDIDKPKNLAKSVTVE